MSADSDRLGEVLERAIEHLSMSRDAEIVDAPIPLRLRIIANDEVGFTVNSASSYLRTADLDVLARAFVNMNQDAEEIPPLTKTGISDIPKEEGGSQLDISGLLAKHENEIREWKGFCNALTKAGQVQAETIANLVMLLKEKESGR